MTPAPAPASLRRWVLHHHRGTAQDLHALAWPTPVPRSVWAMALTRDALVLGSTQARSIVDPAVLDAGRLDVVTRRSGGGAVLLGATTSLWIDVLVPRHDPLWVEDVGRSFDWVGGAWVRALRALGAAGDLGAFEGPMRRTAASDLVCFAGLGPGEVTIDGRKAIGLSQRRTRAGARFQCLAYLGPASAGAEIVPLLAAPTDPDARLALVDQLRTQVVTLPFRAAELREAFVASLPR